jgi:hypothetical protein
MSGSAIKDVRKTFFKYGLIGKKSPPEGASSIAPPSVAGRTGQDLSMTSGVASVIGKTVHHALFVAIE